MAEPELEVDPLEKIGEGEAPEAPEEAEDSQPQEPETPESQSRDEQGRFTAEEVSSEGQVETPPEEPQETPPEPVLDPFTYRADNQQYDIAGATTGEDGAVTIPKDSVPHLQQVLSAGRHHFGGWQRERQGFQEQVKQAQSEVEASVQTRAALLEQFESVVKMTPDQRLDWAEGFAGEWPAIKAKAEQAGVEAGRQADQERLKQYERDAYARELEPQLQEGLEAQMTRAHAEDPLLRSLTQDDMKVVYGKLLNGWQTNGLLLNTDGSVWNWERDPQINLVQMRREMEYVASVRRQRNESTGKVTEAQKANEAEMSESKAPPAVKAKTGPPVEGKPVKRFKLPKGVDPNSDEATELVDAWAEDQEVPADF